MSVCHVPVEHAPGHGAHLSLPQFVRARRPQGAATVFAVALASVQVLSRATATKAALVQLNLNGRVKET